MKRIRKLKRGTVAVIILSILMAVSIGFIRGTGEQENNAHVNPELTPEQEMH
jgi:hypothetical protein